MPNVIHSELTDPNLHEPKGVADADVGSIYVADGDGSGAWGFPIKKYSVSITGSEVSANTTEEHTYTVTGLVAATDKIIGVSKPTHQAGLGIVGWRISANDTLAVTWMNCTGSGITPTNETLTLFAHRA